MSAPMRSGAASGGCAARNGRRAPRQDNGGGTRPAVAWPQSQDSRVEDGDEATVRPCDDGCPDIWRGERGHRVPRARFSDSHPIRLKTTDPIKQNTAYASVIR